MQHFRTGRARGARRGNIVVFSAFLMAIFMAMLALSVDLGYIFTMQAQLQRAVDAAALAGAGELVNGVDASRSSRQGISGPQPSRLGTSVIDRRPTWPRPRSRSRPSTPTTTTSRSATGTRRRASWKKPPVMPATLRVSMTYPNLPFFFARVMGHDNFTLQRQSTAMFQPRDIVVVLDFSASMNDDSTFAAIGKLSQAHGRGEPAELLERPGSARLWQPARHAELGHGPRRAGERGQRVCRTAPCSTATRRSL